MPQKKDYTCVQFVKACEKSIYIYIYIGYMMKLYEMQMVELLISVS